MASRSGSKPLPVTSSEQFAIVRSVAVTAPIEALAADERHRLAILFVVDPRSDLRLLLEDVEAAAHTDERRRLAGLLSHGLDALADVLRRSVGRLESPGSVSPWLAEYLQRRIHVTGWLLDHWNERPAPARFGRRRGAGSRNAQLARADLQGGARRQRPALASGVDQRSVVGKRRRPTVRLLARLAGGISKRRCRCAAASGSS